MIRVGIELFIKLQPKFGIVYSYIIQKLSVSFITCVIMSCSIIVSCFFMHACSYVHAEAE